MQLLTSEGWWLRENLKENISPIDKLYNRFDGMYPHKFRSAFADKIAIQNWRESWAEAFDADKITGKEVMDGLASCRMKHDWPPSLTEFIECCRPKINYDKAYYEALEGLASRDNGEVGIWSHPAIFFASNGLKFDLQRKTYSEVKERWRRAIDSELDKREWPDITLPMKILPAPAFSKESAANELAKLKANDIFAGTGSSKRDHKGWAKKIIARKNEGDKFLTFLQIQFAEEAL